MLKAIKKLSTQRLCDLYITIWQILESRKEKAIRSGKE